MFTPAPDAVEAVQADHPVQPVAPGHAIKVDFSGKEIWRAVTAQECWGFDVAPNGLWTAAACDDNMVYISDQQGSIVQTISANVHQVRFTPDSKGIVAAAPNARLSLLDVATGNILWTYSGHDGTVRNVRWSADGARISVGFDGGQGRN